MTASITSSNTSSLLALPCVLMLLALAAGPLHAGQEGHITGNLPAFDAADAEAKAITADDLLANERFWPYQVALVEPWTPEGRTRPLPPRINGVLVRVESGGRARIDFGRDGLAVVPVSITNLVERANQVRRGELDKIAPNFLLAVGPRLLHSKTGVPRPFDVASAWQDPGFLCVFADSSPEELAKLAEALAPLAGRHGVSTLLFPHGPRTNREVLETLRDLDWKIPFMYDHLSESYTKSLLPEDVGMPAVVLQTNEGRVVLESSWKPGVVDRIREAMDREFGDGRDGTEEPFPTTTQ
ncbi:MAG: hypothetical protein ACQGVK_11185 [Myxococcota bacterium]